MTELMTSAAIRNDEAFGLAFGRIGVEPTFGLNPGGACGTAPMVPCCESPAGDGPANEDVAESQPTGVSKI